MNSVLDRLLLKKYKTFIEGNNHMQIWVDADSCPKPIKEILYRVAIRKSITVTLVANKHLRVPVSQHINTILVPAGFDVADDKITMKVQTSDLVITADIPFAAAVIKKGGYVISPRGKFLTKKNIGEHLSIRNFMDELRNTGVTTGGPAPFKQKDRENFANQLNIFITKHIHT